MSAGLISPEASLLADGHLLTVSSVCAHSWGLPLLIRTQVLLPNLSRWGLELELRNLVVG